MKPGMLEGEYRNTWASERSWLQNREQQKRLLVSGVGMASVNQKETPKRLYFKLPEISPLNAQPFQASEGRKTLELRALLEVQECAGCLG